MKTLTRKKPPKPSLLSIATALLMSLLSDEQAKSLTADLANIADASV